MVVRPINLARALEREQSLTDEQAEPERPEGGSKTLVVGAASRCGSPVGCLT